MVIKSALVSVVGFLYALLDHELTFKIRSLESTRMCSVFFFLLDVIFLVSRRTDDSVSKRNNKL